MKRLTLRVTDELYDKIWTRHSDTREPINKIISDILEKELK